MRSSLRLGAVAGIGLGALLLATVLASPAFAWHSNVSVNSFCLDDGQVRVNYTVTAWKPGQAATVDVAYSVNGSESIPLTPGKFTADDDVFAGHVDLAAGTTGTVTVTATVHWADHETSPPDSGSDDLPPAGHCGGGSSSSTAPPTSAPPTSAPPTTAPSSSLAPTTSNVAVGGVTSTTSGGGALPFTGTNSGPMLLAGILLVGGGALFLLLSRSSERHTAR
jgi:chitinase